MFLDKDGTLKLYPINSFEKKIKILRVRKINFGRSKHKTLIFDGQNFSIKTANQNINVIL